MHENKKPTDSDLSSGQQKSTGFRSFRTQWTITLLGLAIIGLILGRSLYQERQELLREAHQRLSDSAKTTAFSIERDLRSINNALVDLDKIEKKLSQRPGQASPFQPFLDMLPRSVNGIRTVMIFDKDGIVTASNRLELVRSNFSDRTYFQTARKNPMAAALYVPTPFKTSLGTLTLNLMRLRFNQHGEFDGIVSAALDPEDFKPLLNKLRHTPDIAAGLIHGSGTVIWYDSNPEVLPLTNVASEDSFFSRHLNSGGVHSTDIGTCHFLPNQRLVATHTIQPADLSMTSPLLIVLSREIDSVLAPWYHDVRDSLIFFFLILGGSLISLVSYQRRQNALATTYARHRNEKARMLDRLELATAAVNTGIWEFNLASQKMTWDNAMFKLHDLDRQDLSPSLEEWQNRILLEDRENVIAKLNDAIARGCNFEARFRILLRDGSSRAIESIAKTYEDETPNTRRLIGVCRDITEQQHAINALRHGRDFIKDVLDSLTDHIAVISKDGTIVSINHAWQYFSSHNGGPSDPESLIGVNYLAVCDKADADGSKDAGIVASAIRGVLAGQLVTFDYEYDCHSPEQRRWFNLHITPLRGEFTGAVLTHENITSRKMAEESLRNSQQLTQQFIDHLPGLAYLKDEQRRVLIANRAFQTTLGLDPATLVGKNNTELFPGEFGKKIDDDDIKILASGTSSLIEETFGGRYFETRKFVIVGEEGQRMLGGITLDTTVTKRFIDRQQALLEISEIGGTVPEKEFLTRGLEIAERLTGSRMGFLHFVNEDQETIELVTWTAAALTGCTAAHASHYPISNAGIWADCAREKHTIIFNDYANHQAKHGLPAGHVKLDRLITVPVIEENKVRVILGLGNKSSDYDSFDATTLQLMGNDLWRIVRRARVEAALEERLNELTLLNANLDQTNNMLVQSEKLAAIGQLAAGVAHEINNPIGYVTSNLNSLAGYVDDLLTVDSAYSDIARRHANTLPEVFKRAEELKSGIDHAFIVTDIRHLIDESREGLERVRKIVQDLKDFSRVGATGWQRANLHEGLESTLNIVWNEIKYKANVIRNYDHLPEICCIPSQINQVFLNLLTNAAQSIDDHGTITLRSGSDGEYVWIEVGDTGCGISPEDLKHIFEPFFTTKPVGKGTGLGLSLSWGIVNRHHGRIEVNSKLGEGTTFKVILPIDQPQASDTESETTAA